MGTSTIAALVLRSSVVTANELQTAIVIIITENDEESLEFAPEAIANDLEDLDEVLIGKGGRQR